MIEVRLFATFRERREKISFLEAEQVSSAGEIADFFEIPAEEIAICLINGRHSALDAPVTNGDVVALFPPVGGG